MSEVETFATFWEHLEELRRVLIRCCFFIFVGISCCFLFHEKVLTLLTFPLNNHSAPSLIHQKLKHERILNAGPESIAYSLPTVSTTPYYYSPGVKHLDNQSFLIPPHEFLDITSPEEKEKLIIFGPLEGFSITLKICFWAGLVGSSPLWMLQIIQFIAPAMRRHQKWLILPFLILSILFISLGFLFAFFITIPLANQYLYAFNQEIGINLWSLSHYLDYTVLLLLANGLAFELSVVGLLLVHLEILNVEKMSQLRRHVIIAAFILAAILTPPDILTQFMLAIPLIILYEFIILYAQIIKKTRKRKTTEIIETTEAKKEDLAES